MSLHAMQPGEHSVPRPLPEPPRTHQASRLSKIGTSRDALTKALEEWLSEVKLRYTLGGD